VKTTERTTVSVTVYPYREGVGYGNIIWAERDRGTAYYRVSRFAPRGGRFPKDHPATPGALVFNRDLPGQCGESDALTRFRGLGYWASCFPEGDGITWEPLNGQTDEQCLADIRECWPEWNVKMAAALKEAKA